MKEERDPDRSHEVTECPSQRRRCGDLKIGTEGKRQYLEKLDEDGNREGPRPAGGPRLCLRQNPHQHRQRGKDQQQVEQHDSHDHLESEKGEDNGEEYREDKFTRIRVTAVGGLFEVWKLTCRMINWMLSQVSEVNPFSIWIRMAPQSKLALIAMAPAKTFGIKSRAGM